MIDLKNPQLSYLLVSSDNVNALSSYLYSRDYYIVDIQGYYEGIVPLVDGLVEAYQGNHELIYFDTVDEIDNNANIENIIKYFDNLLKIVEKLRKHKDLVDTWIQNDIDAVASLILSTKYKLENLE